MPDYRRLVEENTVQNGRGSHRERHMDTGVMRKITYALYDCKHCGEKSIATKADFDSWEVAWVDVEYHLSVEHPEKLPD